MKKNIIALLLTTGYIFALSIAQIPKNVVINDKNGACADGTEWNSSMLKGKKHLLLYIDPDDKDNTERLLKVLKSKNYDNSKYGLVAIINLKATWLPNFAIEKKIKEKQKKFPNKLYVLDKSKYLLKEWKLVDNSLNVILFDKQGKVIYTHTGIITNNQIQKLLLLIDDTI